MYRKLNINKLAHRGFIVVVVALGLIVLVQGVGAALGLIDGDHEIVWTDIALTLLTGLALLAGIWIIERSALLGAGLVVIGMIVIGVATLWTIIISIAMAIVAMGALIRAATAMRDRKSLA